MKEAERSPAQMPNARELATPDIGDGDAERQRRMSLLAHADMKHLVSLWQQMDLDPRCEMLRGPETGLIALRGRIGGGGAPFNFGEATVTRATVRLESGAVGHSIMLGRNQSKAKLAAVIDALAEDAELCKKIETLILTPLAHEASQSDLKQAAEIQATKVNFFTMVRGED